MLYTSESRDIGKRQIPKFLEEQLTVPIPKTKCPLVVIHQLQLQMIDIA